MSRLARKPLEIPAGVTVSTEAATARITGPKGVLVVPLLSGVTLATEGTSLFVNKKDDERESRANVGTVWSLIRNALSGVVSGFTKTLEIQGVGYKAAMDGAVLVLSLGYVHPVRFTAPESVTMSVEKNLIHISGCNKDLVGLAAAKIRSLKKPEPYKGKGIRYQGEVIKLKAGKKAATGS